MAVSAIIFDCDGTLVDTEIMSARIDVAYFSRRGIHFKDEHDYLAQFMGIAKIDIVKKLNAQYGTHISADEFQDEFASGMIGRIPYDMNFFPESVEVVRSLVARGLKLAVASNGQRQAVLEELRVPGYLDLIGADHVFAVQDAANPKPAPDLYLAAARKLGVEPGSCLVVEDSVPGARGGVAAGMNVVGYTGFAHDKVGTEKRLLEAGCFKVIKILPELSGLIAR